jgi:tripartite-type tricarboxylate transporter receptor subunit TctC
MAVEPSRSAARKNNATPNRRRTIAACLGAFAALSLPRDGHPQAYPDRTISYIVPSSPGSSPDIVGRIMAEALAKILGQPVVVMNRPGAGGTIAAAAAAKAMPDGYTILQANTNHSFSQTFYKNLGYNLEQDFSPVGRFASAFYIVLVHPKVGVRTLRELIEKARSAPGMGRSDVRSMTVLGAQSTATRSQLNSAIVAPSGPRSMCAFLPLLEE